MGRMTIEEQKAEQQLLGFKHREQGFSLRDLVISMGLTKDEWKNIKSESEINYLSDTDIEEIDNLLKL